MNDFRKDFREVAIGIIAVVITSALLRGFAQDGLIPSCCVSKAGNSSASAITTSTMYAVPDEYLT
jgi:hypothetical protein